MAKKSEKNIPKKQAPVQPKKSELDNLTLADGKINNIDPDIERGIFASGSRQDIRDKLLREFKSTNKGTISMLVQNPAVVLDPNNPKHKKTLKILGEL